MASRQQSTWYVQQVWEKFYSSTSSFSNRIIISLENSLRGRELSQVTTHTLQFTFISHPAGNCKSYRKPKTHLSCHQKQERVSEVRYYGPKYDFQKCNLVKRSMVLSACLLPCESRPLSELFMPLPSFDPSPSSLSWVREKGTFLSYLL